MADLIKIAGPWGVVVAGFLVVCFLAGAGLIAIVIRWKKIKAALLNGNGDARRRDDDLVQQLIKQNAEMMGVMMKVVADNTDALRGMKDALEVNGRKLDGIPPAINGSFRDIHARLDVLMRRAG